MPKPDPALLDPARYPFACSIETRFGDLDLNQHINNAAMVGLLEEGRVRFQRALARGPTDTRTSRMLVSLAVEFLDQSYFPDPVHMHVGIERMGRTSYTLCQLGNQRGRVVLFARATVVVTVDGRPAELPAQVRESLEPWSLRL